MFGMTPRVASDSVTVRRAVEKMIDTAVAYGLVIHPSLRVEERDGELAVHSDAADGDVLMRFSEDLLIPLAGVEWQIDNEQFSIKAHTPQATNAQRNLAECLVGVYNATNKLAWASAYLPECALASESAAVSALRSLQPHFLSQCRSIVEAFVDTRSFRHRDGPTLLPLVDLMNHHRHGAPLITSDGSIVISVNHPRGGTECYVRYARRLDALDLALTYGYGDLAVPYSRSIPVTLDVDDVGVVEVSGWNAVPKSLLDPPQVAVEPGRLTLSHVTFHAHHPDRLTAVMQLAVIGLLRRSGLASIDPEAATRSVIRSIATYNLNRLDEAREVVAAVSSPAADMVVAALGTQRANIATTLSALD